MINNHYVKDTVKTQKYIPYEDVLVHFRLAMAHAGILTNEQIIADDKLHRIHVEGDKRGTKNGAYIIHADGHPSGWYMHYSSGISGTWTLSGKRQPMTLAMRQAIETSKQQTQIAREQAARVATEKAVYLWSKSTPIVEPYSHAYLNKKRIQPYGLRVIRESLVVPIYDTSKQMVNLQFIDVEGNKRFLSGGKKKGCFSVIGNYREGKIMLISEGWATGASLHQTTGHFVVVALDAHNLKPVAQAFQKLHPNAEIVIAGDNDKSGKGQTEAKKAALAIGGKYIIPATPGHDWNDAINEEFMPC